jgi:hypothetical protein
MTGMEMALKSFGLDPAKIKAELTQILTTTVLSIMAEVNDIKASQKRIESKLDLIIQHESIEYVISEEVTNGVSGKLDTGISGN